MFVYVVVVLVAMILGGVIASNKGRSVVGWVLLGFLLPITILILLALPSKKPAAAIPGHSAGMPLPAPDDKKCPDCAEMVKSAANKCRFCGHEFPPAPVSKRKCPTCHDKMPASATLCIGCGCSSPIPRVG